MAKINKSYIDIFKLFGDIEFNHENVYDLYDYMKRFPEVAPAFKDALMLIHQLIEDLEAIDSDLESEDGWEQAIR